MPIVLITIPFFLGPCFAGIQHIINQIEARLSPSPAFCLIGFPKYIVGPSRGSLRLIIAFGKSCAIALACLLGTTVIYAPIAIAVDPSFASALDHLGKYASGDSTIVVDQFLNDPSLLRYYAVAMSVMLFAFCVIYLRHIAIHLLNLNYRYRMQNVDGRMMNRTFLVTYSKIKGPIRKMIARPCWIGISLFAFGYISGFLQGILYFGWGIGVPLLGLLFGFGLFAFYAPYYGRYSNLVSYYFSMDYRQIALETVLQGLEMVHQRNMISEEEYTQAKTSLDDAAAKIAAERITFDPLHYPMDDSIDE